MKVSPHFLDSKFKDVCLFAQVGSYSYDDNRMLFDVSTLGYIQQSQSITLDYKITINNLNKRDQIFNGGALGNFSLAGFEMVLTRYVSTYIITYYLPSGNKVNSVLHVPIASPYHKLSYLRLRYPKILIPG